MASSTSEASAEHPRQSFRYQTLLVGLLSLNFGIVCFDRAALSFLTPFLKPELGLSNTQVGLLASALSLTWSIAAFGMGNLSDRIDKRKLPLILCTVAFSLCSFVSGLAASFAMLIAARLLMGLAEGGVMPISHAMVAHEVSPERRGIAQGIAQSVGSNFLGGFVAPVVLVAFASIYGWRNAFFLAGVPGLVSALLLLWLVREPLTPKVEHAVKESKKGIGDVLKKRNIVICMMLSVLLLSHLSICMAFMPLFLTESRHLSAGAASWLMGTLGISATIGGFAICALSDRIGRRPVMVIMPLLGVILPLAAMFYDGSLGVIAAIFFFGWGLNGIFPLFMATVPSESVDARHVATALGLCMGSGEVLGGVMAPALAGSAADAWGLKAPLWIMIGLSIAAGLTALGLTETAPSQRQKIAH
jgi:ACS family hexuronate transporter-like MFS transporter